MPCAIAAKPMINNMLRKISRRTMTPLPRRIRWKKTIPHPRRISLPARLRITFRPFSSNSAGSDGSSCTSLGTLSSISLFLNRRLDKNRQQPRDQNAYDQKPHPRNVRASLVAQISKHLRPDISAEISERVDQADRGCGDRSGHEFGGPRPEDRQVGVNADSHQ